MANIEFVQGSESHSSSWGKYYIKGLEKYQVKEEQPGGNQYDKHQSYTGYVCLDIPEGTMFSIFEQSGNKRGTDTYKFSICVTSDAQYSDNEAKYGNGFVKGNWEIVAEAEDKIKSPRLMNWWIESKDKSLAFAQWCAANINKRGIKELPPMPPTQVQEFMRLQHPECTERELAEAGIPLTSSIETLKLEIERLEIELASKKSLLANMQEQKVYV